MKLKKYWLVPWIVSEGSFVCPAIERSLFSHCIYRRKRLCRSWIKKKFSKLTECIQRHGWNAKVNNLLMKLFLYKSENKWNTTLTKEWPAQGGNGTVDGDSSDSVPAFTSTFDQVQLLKSRTYIVPLTE